MVGKIQPRALPGDLRPGRRPAARRRRRAREIRRAGARRSPPPPAGRRRRAHVAEGFLRVAVANMANAIKQVSIQKGHDATRYRPAMLRRRRRPARLPGGRRARHGDGVHPPLRRRALGLRHGPRRPERDPRGRGGSAALGRRHGASCDARLDALAEAGRAELLRAGRRPGAHRRARGGCTCATPAPTASCPSLRRACRGAWTPSPPRTAQRFGFATPERQVVVEACVAEVTAAGEQVEEAALPPRDGGEPPEPIDTRRALDRAAPSTRRRCSTARRCAPATASPARR